MFLSLVLGVPKDAMHCGVARCRDPKLAFS